MNEQKPSRAHLSEVEPAKEVLKLDSDEASRIVDLMDTADDVEVHKDVFGLEIAGLFGDVSFLPAAYMSSKRGETLQTRLSKVPIADYTDSDGQHVVSLYAVKVSGFAVDVGKNVCRSLFAMDKVIRPDGSTRLASNPGHIWSEGRNKDTDIEGADDTQLTTAILGSFENAEDLTSFISQAYEGEESIETRAKLEEALRSRDPERVNYKTGRFTDHHWYKQRIMTTDEAQELVQRHEARENERAEKYGRSSVFRRALAKAAWYLTDPEDRSGDYRDHLK